MKALLWIAIAVSVVTSCGNRPGPLPDPHARTPAASRHVALGASIEIDAAPQVAIDAASIPADASAPSTYRVRLSSPSRVVTIDRDPNCAAEHASCKPEACFVPAPYVDRPASSAAMIACKQDSDCTVSQTVCCKPDRNDVRAIRVDQAATLTNTICGKGAIVCSSPDPVLLASFRVGCVENTCRLLDTLAPAWCEDRDTRYRVLLRNGKVAARERTFDCFGHAPSCSIDANCYREVARRAPRPPAELRRCSRDADCMMRPATCCDCGATEFRAVRMDAEDKWQRFVCGAGPQTCPACDGGPSGLWPVCLNGSCEAFEPRDEAECAAK
jgi:hypothetical protein